MANLFIATFPRCMFRKEQWFFLAGRNYPNFFKISNYVINKINSIFSLKFLEFRVFIPYLLRRVREMYI
jgi:hypothetical protein